MMKFRLPSRPLPNHPNPNRIIPSHTLHIRHSNSILISSTHLSRRKLRLTYPIYARQRGLYILHLPIPPRRTRRVLRLIQYNRNMKHRNRTTIRCYSNSIHRLRTSMRTNIILRCHSNYKPTISHSIRRHNTSRVNLRGFFSG